MDISEIRKKAKELDKGAPKEEAKNASVDEGAQGRSAKAAEQDADAGVSQGEPISGASADTQTEEILKTHSPVQEADSTPEVETKEDSVETVRSAPVSVSGEAAAEDEFIEDYIIDDEEPAQSAPASSAQAVAAVVGSTDSVAASAAVDSTGAPASSAEASVEDADDEDEFLEAITFTLCGETYAVDIRMVKEVIKPRELTNVPRASGAILGVLSLRGTIVPFMDIPHILKLAPSMCVSQDSEEELIRERVIIVRDEEELMAFKVDSIEQVVKVPRKSLEAPPVMDISQAELIAAIGRSNGVPFILLEMDKVMSRI